MWKVSVSFVDVSGELIYILRELKSNLSKAQRWAERKIKYNNRMESKDKRYLRMTHKVLVEIAYVSP